MKMKKGYDFDTRLGELKRIVTEKYLNSIFVHAPHFTLHGKDHSLAMESYLTEFLTISNSLPAPDFPAINHSNDNHQSYLMRLPPFGNLFSVYS